LSIALLEKIESFAKEELGFAELGLISLNAEVNVTNGVDSKSLEVFNHLNTAVIKKHDWAKSVIVLIRPYTPYKTDFPHGYGSYSAHFKQFPLGRKASQILASFIEKEGYRAASDSGIPLKPAVFCSGLGFYGKNCVIHAKNYGSWMTIHSVATDIEFNHINVLAEQVTDCDDCEICIKVCPTKAIMHDGSLSKGRCLREHMLQKNFVPLEMRKLMGRCILGCDICQIVCPKNKNMNSKAILPPGDEVKAFDIESILTINSEMDGIPDSIKNLIGENYAKKESILSSTVIIAGNMKEMKFTPHFIRLLYHPYPFIRSHAAWALAETDARLAKEVLIEAIARETDETVRLEMEKLIV